MVEGILAVNTHLASKEICHNNTTRLPSLIPTTTLATIWLAQLIVAARLAQKIYADLAA
jgi:hypothetical protein